MFRVVLYKGVIGKDENKLLLRHVNLPAVPMVGSLIHVGSVTEYVTKVIMAVDVDTIAAFVEPVHVIGEHGDMGDLEAFAKEVAAKGHWEIAPSSFVSFDDYV